MMIKCVIQCLKKHLTQISLYKTNKFTCFYNNKADTLSHNYIHRLQIVTDLQGTTVNNNKGYDWRYIVSQLHTYAFI